MNFHSLKYSYQNLKEDKKKKKIQIQSNYIRHDSQCQKLSHPGGVGVDHAATIHGGVHAADGGGNGNGAH